MRQMLKRACQRYTCCLVENPVAVKATTGLTLGLAGDVIAQKCIERRNELDLRRVAAFGLFGTAWTGVWGHYYGKWIHARFPGTLLHLSVLLSFFSLLTFPPPLH